MTRWAALHVALTTPQGIRTDAGNNTTIALLQQGD
jgi:hypothetical protein